MKKRFVGKRALALLLTVAIGCLCLVGCQSDSNGDGDIAKVVWYIPDLIQGNMVDEVMQEVNTILKDRYGMELELYGPGREGFATQMQLMNSSREEYDLAFTSNWTNNYFTGISNGVFADITDLLPEHAPKLYESIEDYVWESISSDGRIYAVPNWQVMARSTGLAIPTSKLEKTGFKIEDINTMDDLTEYLKAINALEPNTNRIQNNMWATLASTYDILALIDNTIPGSIYVSKEGKPIVFNQFESEEYAESVKNRRLWVTEGYAFNAYAPDYDGSLKERQEVPFSIVNYKPGIEADLERNLGYDMTVKQFSPGILSTTGITSAMTGVSSTSKNPVNAVKMLEIMNTDRDILNLLCWGIEGKNYEKVSENRISPIKDSGYTNISNWILGSQKNSFVSGTQSDTVWEETEEFNNNGLVSPVLGFNFNADNVGVEITNCQAVVDENIEFLELGLVDEESYKSFVDKLKKAGADTIIKELQKQVDEWWAANKK